MIRKKEDKSEANSEFNTEKHDESGHILLFRTARGCGINVRLSAGNKDQASQDSQV
jgi:hypothetical protein